MGALRPGATRALGSGADALRPAGRALRSAADALLPATAPARRPGATRAGGLRVRGVEGPALGGRVLAAPLIWALVLAGLLAVTANAGRAGAEEGPVDPAEVGASAPGVRVDSPEDGLRATFPEAPRFDATQETTLLGTLRTRSWEVDHGALRLRVERHELPPLAARVLGGEWLLERAERDLLANLAARDVEAEPAPWGAHPGRRLRYEPGDRPGEREEARLVLAGRLLYVVFARGAGGNAALAERFARSVEIVDD